MQNNFGLVKEFFSKGERKEKVSGLMEGENHKKREMRRKKTETTEKQVRLQTNKKSIYKYKKRRKEMNMRKIYSHQMQGRT